MRRHPVPLFSPGWMLVDTVLAALVALMLSLVFLVAAHASPAIVTLYGTVNEASAHQVISAIQAANRDTKNHDPIILYIDSGGGELFAGASIVDAMDASRRPVWTVDVRFAASMAAIIHSYGAKRYMLPRAVLMHHEASGGVEGSPAQMASRLASVSAIVEGFEKHVAKVAHLSLAEFRAREARNWWMLAEDAVKAHLADEIVNPPQYPSPEK